MDTGFRRYGEVERSSRVPSIGNDGSLSWHRKGFLRGLAGLIATAIGHIARAQARPVLVFAAASLKTALDATAAAWRRETGKEVTISYAASSTLAKQIDNGAPAELFVSADEDWMDYLEERKLIDPQTPTHLPRNPLLPLPPPPPRSTT